jgi:hypothetical protein
MRLATALTTRLAEEAGEAVVPRSEVLLDGAPTGKFVQGAILEAAIECDGRYLLFMTDDVPFEDALGIHLLDGELHVLDSAVIGGPYSTGTFSSLELSGPHTVRFRFVGDTTWSVELLPRPGFRLPLLSEPAGVRRSPGFSRHFVVHGNPRPQTS